MSSRIRKRLRKRRSQRPWNGQVSGTQHGRDGSTASRGGGTSCGCSGSPVTCKSRATRLPTVWPRQQQQANAMAVANLDGFCHGAWPTLRGRQLKLSREERRSGLKSEPSNGGLISPHETRVPQGTEEREKAVASRCYQLLTGHALIAPSSKTSSRKQTRTNAGDARPVNDKPEITSSKSAGGGRLKSMCYGQP